DYVMEISKIPAVLLRRAGQHEVRETNGEEAARFSSLLALLRVRLGLGFDAYKKNTLMRRVRRRMGLRRAKSLAAYLAILRNDSEELRSLAHDFLIGVTDFFREPEAWAALEKMVVQPLVRTASAESAIRVWVAGCASGQEAYCVAMVFLEQIEASGRAIDL